MVVFPAAEANLDGTTTIITFITPRSSTDIAKVHIATLIASRIQASPVGIVAVALKHEPAIITELLFANLTKVKMLYRVLFARAVDKRTQESTAVGACIVMISMCTFMTKLVLAGHALHRFLQVNYISALWFLALADVDFIRVIQVALQFREQPKIHTVQAASAQRYRREVMLYVLPQER